MDYTKATWHPVPNFWPGGNSMQRIVIHGTASGAHQTAIQLATSSEFNDGSSASVHYINDVDGTVIQIVKESDSAWGNCCVTGAEAPAGYYPLPGSANWHLHGLDQTHNYNHDTISIENIKYSSDNSEALTIPQYNSLVALVADIAKRRNIPPIKGRIIGHFDLDPVNRARCPGNFDWPRFYKDVQMAMGYGPIPTDQAEIYALQAGFRDSNVQTILAIAQSESGLMQYRQGINTDGSIDRGILQFNSHWHPEVTDSMAYDPSQAFKEAFRVSGGSNFSAWNSYKSGGYKQYLVNTTTTSTGEIAVFEDADQFQPAKTQGACGFFSVAIVDAAAPVGKQPLKSVSQVIAEAEQWYAQYDGSNDISNFDGMNLNQLYQLLGQIGLRYYPLTTDKDSQESGATLDQIRSWVKSGFPVIINSVEDSYYDMGLGDKVPYYWNGTGLNHIISLTGVTSDGNFLVRDSANVTDLNNPNSLRPGPRKYDASKMQILWATAVVMHGQSMPSVQGGVPVGLPAGWKDDGKYLHNPVNSFVVGAGFRTVVLGWPGGWEPWNVPLENEHPSKPLEHSNLNLGDGNSQLFRNRRLEYQYSTRKMFEGWLGQEALWLTNKYDADQTEIAKDVKSISDLTAQSASFQSQLEAAIANGAISQDEQTAINNVLSAVQALMQYKK